MRIFDVYKDPNISDAPTPGNQNGWEAIKKGFSWPALLFNFWWGLVKGLWRYSLLFIVLLILQILVSMLPGLGKYIGSVFAFASLGLCVYFGLKGNEWRRANTVKNGYEKFGTVSAKNPISAIMAIYEGQGKG